MKKVVHKDTLSNSSGKSEKELVGVTEVEGRKWTEATLWQLLLWETQEAMII